MREYWAYVSLIGYSLALTIAFIIMKVTGRFIAIEPNQAVFWGEISLFMVTMIFAAIGLTATLRKGFVRK